MSQITEVKRLYAVVCLHCKQRISIPESMAELQRSETKRVREAKCQVFHLRCLKCGKEKPYKVAEIFEVEEGQAGALRIEHASSWLQEKVKAANG